MPPVQGRRFIGTKILLVGREWKDVTRELQELLDKIWGFNADGIPPGFQDIAPIVITPDATSDAGDETLGWAAADHTHGIECAVAVDLGDSNAEGNAATFSRSDHIHARSVRAYANGVLVGTRRDLDFREGLTVTDDPGNNQLDIDARECLAAAFMGF